MYKRQRIGNAVIAYTLYLKKMFWPTDLTVLYPFEYVTIQQVFIAGFFVLMISMSVVKYMRKYPFLAVGWFWYLGTLVPVSGIIQVGIQSMADRYGYIPFIGIFILFAWGGYILLGKHLKVFLVISAAGIAGLAMITYKQVQYWENSDTLYRHAIEVTNPHYVLHKNYGLYLLSNNKHEEAAQHFRKAIALRKNDPALHNSLGVSLLMMNDLSGAAKEFKAALLYNPTHARAHNNLGMILLNQGRSGEAMMHFQEAVRLEPMIANAHYQLAGILKIRGMDEEADFHYQQALRINPGYESRKNH